MTKKLSKFVSIILVLLLSAFSVFAVDGLLSVSQTVHSTGSITAINLSVYSDPAGTVPCSNITWPNVTPGSSVNLTVYIKNTGNAAEVLSLAANNWIPANASNYLSITWNLQSYTLAPGAIIAANLSLAASSSIDGITNFSVDLQISGSN